MGCRGRCCPDHQNKSKKLPALEEKSNTTQEDNEPEGVDTGDLDGSNDPKPLINQVKRRHRVAKVAEHQQAIVLLHGLHRLSYDFNKMKEVLQQTFPYATIVPLTCVNKDPSKQGGPSPTVERSIKEQAELAYEEIKTKVAYGSRVVLVGHSQGGLRGFVLVKEYRDRLKSENGIVINQLITIGTLWKGAPVMDHIKNIKNFKKKFEKIEAILDTIKKDYAKDVIKYFFKFKPKLAERWPSLYEIAVPYFMKKKCPGAADLEPGSAFISKYVALGLKEVDLPITAIAGALTDFSKLFNSFPSSISKQALKELNATYAELIGGNPHDMLLPVATQHAEGLVTKNFKRITVPGASHGNKVGVSVKRGLSELNNEQVIQKVVECVEAAFYKQKEEKVIEQEGYVSLAA
ncbi:esterase/lipase family protein [Cardinium endosymbiont of Oedothorax gibbosus]|uniref:esterase/lipase family protein n=1 Tax=Cardinium endosymbiont of Oedothorax gibbosus TaxID=931101 RepID=UPI0020257344|nr:alpha/beta hydrolase [Cardinium endosymbiont of Oedothorax gibbosus]